MPYLCELYKNQSLWQESVLSEHEARMQKMHQKVFALWTRPEGRRVFVAKHYWTNLRHIIGCLETCLYQADLEVRQHIEDGRMWMSMLKLVSLSTSDMETTKAGLENYILLLGIFQGIFFFLQWRLASACRTYCKCMKLLPRLRGQRTGEAFWKSLGQGASYRSAWIGMLWQALILALLHVVIGAPSCE